MHYVPKWSAKLFGLHSTTPNLRNPSKHHWNGMPVLVVGTQGVTLRVSDDQAALVEGVTWGHLLAGLWYQRREVMVNLYSE